MPADREALEMVSVRGRVCQDGAEGLVTGRGETRPPAGAPESAEPSLRWRRSDFSPLRRAVRGLGGQPGPGRPVPSLLASVSPLMVR